MKYKRLSDRIVQTRIYANLYGGPIITAGMTVATFRYLLFPEYESPASEVLKWVGAAVTSLPAQIVSVTFGFLLGVTSALNLAESRTKKRRLENKVQEEG